jgi:hypothetical protein
VGGWWNGRDVVATAASSRAQPVSARIVAFEPALWNMNPTMSGRSYPSENEISVDAA